MRTGIRPCCLFFSRHKARASAKGISLVELLVTIAVLLVLLTVATVISDTFKKRAEKAKCISHMRTLHSALSAHVLDKGHWPQMDDDEENWTESKFFKFWIESLEPYGTSADNWVCPSDKLFLQFRKVDKDEYFGSYVPTPFDKAPSTPFRWNQPWLIERGDFHGKGSHMLMPDGSVQESQNPFSGR